MNRLFEILQGRSIVWRCGRTEKPRDCRRDKLIDHPIVSSSTRQSVRPAGPWLTNLHLFQSGLYLFWSPHKRGLALRTSISPLIGSLQLSLRLLRLCFNPREEKDHSSRWYSVHLPIFMLLIIDWYRRIIGLNRPIIVEPQVWLSRRLSVCVFYLAACLPPNRAKWWKDKQTNRTRDMEKQTYSWRDRIWKAERQCAKEDNNKCINRLAGRQK